eukprot:gb/GECH01004669.1/.p1 GENE.gb/GECH01004669.1/~~gb/GECH01004669.1/.p1  ORF type:complete len:319 (+),score=85.94 gb/GECH01004669.1/:1-957(+)
MSEVQIVTPGEVITEKSTGYLRGHGTFVDEDGKLVSSVAGIVSRVNKLITVIPLRARYTGDIGDVVVGRITEVGQKKWRVDVQGRQDAALQLKAINLPGGVQRRRTYEDQLHMRELFVENDLISAEVQQVHNDGTISLHTRSSRYGKLENGQFVRVPAALVKRCKQHFHDFPFGVSAILGNNGFIWLSATPPPEDNGTDATSSGSSSLFEHPSFQTETKFSSRVEVTREIRERMCRVRNAIICLSRLFVAIYPETIIDVYDASKAAEIAPKDMLSEGNISRITEKARNRCNSASATIQGVGDDEDEEEDIDIDMDIGE